MSIDTPEWLVVTKQTWNFSTYKMGNMTVTVYSKNRFEVLKTVGLEDKNLKQF